MHKSLLLLPSAMLSVLAGPVMVHAAPAGVRFVRPSESPGRYDFVEIAIQVEKPDAANPFTDVTVEGQLSRRGSEPVHVDGFCDSADGSVFRIRFLPTSPGDYEYAVTYRQGAYEASHSGKFTATDKRRKGLLRVDKEHPFHFVYEGTGEHYFWNSTTTYWLLGWRDEAIIHESLDRLDQLGVNRIRVALSGRTHDGTRWKEPEVKPSEQFQFRLEPWPAARPENIEDPGYDVTRFNLDHFRKCERMLEHARRHGIQVSIIVHLDGRDKGVDPFGKEGMGGPDEQRYYRYVVARLAAFDNVMWDVTNEWHLFRNEAWVEQMGRLIKDCDPYDHLTSVHGKGVFPFRTSTWADFAMYQSWDEHGGYAFMLKNRQEQVKAGRPMPQVNEEYGYEDHYPYPWGEGRKWPARTADTRRRLVWQMTMAGGYQTTGERANVPGYGGWITGRGDDSMVMFEGYRRMVDFFQQLPWWQLNPDNDFFEAQAGHDPAPGSKETMPPVVGLRSDNGELAVLYFSAGGSVKVKPRALDAGLWSIWHNPRTNVRQFAEPDEQGRFVSPDKEDWVLLFSFGPTGRRANVGYAVTARGLEISGLDQDNPLIYDNDWWFDTPDKNYLWAKASLGQANLPQNEMTQDVQRIAKWFWDRSTRQEKPDRDDGFADGAPIFYFFHHRTWLAVQPQKVTGVFTVQDTTNQYPDLLDARKLDDGLMTEELFRTLKDPAAYGRSHWKPDRLWSLPVCIKRAIQRLLESQPRCGEGVPPLGDKAGACSERSRMGWPRHAQGLEALATFVFGVPRPWIATMRGWSHGFKGGAARPDGTECLGRAAPCER